VQWENIEHMAASIAEAKTKDRLSSWWNRISRSLN